MKQRVSVDVVLNQSDFQSLAASGLPVAVVQSESEMQSNLSSPDGTPAYRSYDTVLAQFAKLQADHPAICKLFDIGDSRGKQYFAAGDSNYQKYDHDIWAMKVSKNVAIEEDEPCILYCGEHHAREPIGLEVTFAVLNYIVSNYGIDSAITRAVNTKQLWFVPLFNPDGHKVVLDSLNTMWRKNLCDNNANGNPETADSDADGVDLNRNYGYKWGGLGYSSAYSDETYGGPSAWTEPEVVAMRDLIDAHHFIAGISYHSYSENVLYAYGYDIGARAPDSIAMNDLAKKMAATIPRQSGTGTYFYGPWYEMYAASGILDDYAYGVRGMFFYTIELGTVFIPPPSDIDKICRDNISAALMLLNRVNTSTLTGHAYAIVNAAKVPLRGSVFVREIDDTAATSADFRYPYKTDSAFGAYFRMLPPGSYAVTFTPDNAIYPPQTVSTVSIDSTDTTKLDFIYDPASAGPAERRKNGKASFRLVTGASDCISIAFSRNQGIFRLEVYTAEGKKVSGIPVDGSSNVRNPVVWNTRGIRCGVYVIRIVESNGQVTALRYSKMR